MTILRRADRVAFRVHGSDAEKLLHDVVTGHVEKTEGPGHWWALLSPQGKIVVEGLIGWQEGAFWLDVHAASVEQFAKQMRLYKMRADVEIENLSDTHVVGWSSDRPDQGVAHVDPRGGGMGVRVISEQSNASDWSDDQGEYTARRIAAGIVEVGADYASGTLFPHDIAMDLNDGIDFEKGCYIGQEVVSRMKHRGTARRRPVIVSGTTAGTGSAISINERIAGELGSVAGESGIAIVRLDRISAPEAAIVEGNPVLLALPSWANYRFGDSGQD